MTLSKEEINYLGYLEDCILLEYNTGEKLSLNIDKGKVWLKSNNGLYKVKELLIKETKKYNLKCTCKEIGADIPTVKVFRLVAYKRVFCNVGKELHKDA